MIPAENELLTVHIGPDDAERILYLLYNSETRWSLIHTLHCGCGAVADRREDPHAWAHWQLLPHPLCPVCRGIDPGPAEYNGPARGRFLALVKQVTSDEVRRIE